MNASNRKNRVMPAPTRIGWIKPALAAMLLALMGQAGGPCMGPPGEAGPAASPGPAGPEGPLGPMGDMGLPGVSPFMTAANGVDIFYTAGNVGINTMAPAATLHVAGDAKVDGTVFTNALSSNSPLALQTAGTTRIHVDDATGNVGIGTSTPAAMLDIAGTARAETLTLTGAGAAETLDQAQQSFSPGLPNVIEVWQSFTAGQTGILSRVEYNAFSTDAVRDAELSVFSGEGLGGTLLGTQSYTLPDTIQWVSILLTNGVPVNSGQQYTLRFLRTAGGTDHSFRLDTGNVYAGGRNSLDPSWDMMFRTYIRAVGFLLDVPGDIRLGNSGQYFATGGQENLRIVRGRIRSDGSLAEGFGFTPSRGALGAYHIVFQPTFPSPPTVTVTPIAGVALMATITVLNPGHTDLIILTNGGALADSSFCFIAIGPK